MEEQIQHKPSFMNSRQMIDLKNLIAKHTKDSGADAKNTNVWFVLNVTATKSAQESIKKCLPSSLTLLTSG